MKTLKTSRWHTIAFLHQSTYLAIICNTKVLSIREARKGYINGFKGF